MIRIGMVGMGGISGAHLPAYEKLADIAQVVARCDKIPERADGTAKGVAINIGGPAATALQATAYTDYRELLADPEVDVVDICLPTDLHAEVAIAALQAGKHVLCEKPMALNVAQCDRMIAAAQASGSIFMIAQCIRFWPAYVYLKELVDSGKYGKLTSAQFSRLSGPPIWASENWLLTPERSGGSLLDLHIHDTDYLSFLLGTPTSVSTRGREDAQGIGYVLTEYQYAGNPLIIAEGGWDFPTTFPFRMTFVARFEQATLEFADLVGPFKVYPVEGEPFTPEISAEQGYYLEIAYFLDCVARGEQPTVVTPQQARESVRIVQAEAESLRTGKPVVL